jgi:hypothetical protein
MTRTVMMSALVLLIAACGGGEASVAQPSTTATAPPTTVAASTTQPPGSTPPASTQPLGTYRFTMSLSVVPESGDVRLVEVLDGEAVVETGAMRIFGQLAGLPIDIVTDGASWWDLEEPDLPLDEQGVRYFLILSGLLMPSDVAGLLEDAGAWEDLGVETHLGAPATHLRRTGIEKDLDWGYGDVAIMDVWRDQATGVVVKLTAMFATGDQSGFPLASWEIVERDPAVDIPIPES